MESSQSNPITFSISKQQQNDHINIRMPPTVSFYIMFLTIYFAAPMDTYSIICFTTYYYFMIIVNADTVNV